MERIFQILLIVTVLFGYGFVQQPTSTYAQSACIPASQTTRDPEANVPWIIEPGRYHVINGWSNQPGVSQDPFKLFIPPDVYVEILAGGTDYSWPAGCERQARDGYAQNRLPATTFEALAELGLCCGQDTFALFWSETATADTVWTGSQEAIPLSEVSIVAYTPCPPAQERTIRDPADVTVTGPVIFHPWWNHGRTSFAQGQVKVMIASGQTVTFLAVQGQFWQYADLPDCSERLPLEFENAPQLTAKSVTDLMGETQRALVRTNAPAQPAPVFVAQPTPPAQVSISAPQYFEPAPQYTAPAPPPVVQQQEQTIVVIQPQQPAHQQPVYAPPPGQSLPLPNQPQPGQDCAGVPEPHDAVRGQTWTPRSNGGIILVNFWSNEGSNQGERKLRLQPGEQPALRGGGTAYAYSVNCADAANGNFAANTRTEVTLAQLQTEGLVGGGTGTQPPPTGSQPSANCSPIRNEVRDPSDQPWSLSGPGPILLTIWTKLPVSGGGFMGERKTLLRANERPVLVNLGGTAYIYPAGCDDAVNRIYAEDARPEMTLQSLISSRKFTR